MVAPGPSRVMAQLAEMLGNGWDVRNFGINGATLLRKGDSPWGDLDKVKDYKPDVIIVMLGTNDSKPKNWKYKEEFSKDYVWMIEEFRKIPGTPKIFISLPCFVIDPNHEINEAAIEEQIPIIEQISKQQKTGLIDMHSPLMHDPAPLLPDHIHPSTAGATKLAEAACQAVTSGKLGQKD